MGWPFSKREYHWYHSHTVNNWVDDNIAKPIETGFSYTPIGVFVDVVSGNAANNPVVGAVVGAVGGGGGGILVLSFLFLLYRLYLCSGYLME